MAYVDLNPIRAGIAETTETSEFTKAYCRIQAINMLEDVAPPPPDAEAHRSGQTTDVASNEAANSRPNEPLAASDAAADGQSAAKQAADSKIDRAKAADWLAPIRLAGGSATWRRSWIAFHERSSIGIWSRT